MLLPKEVENQRFTSIDSIDTISLLEVDLNHNLEEISFQPVSATPHQHQMITTYSCQSITPNQPESITYSKL